MEVGYLGHPEWAEKYQVITMDMTKYSRIINWSIHFDIGIKTIRVDCKELVNQWLAL